MKVSHSFQHSSLRVPDKIHIWCQEYVLPTASPSLFPSIKHFSSLKNSSMNLAASQDLSVLGEQVE